MGFDGKFLNAHFNEIVEFSELKGFLVVPIKIFSSRMLAGMDFPAATIVEAIS